VLLLHQNSKTLKEVKPYETSGDGKKSQVSRMFNNIAPYYDFLNHFLSLGIDRGWRIKAVAKLRDKPYPIIIDIATGTADVAITAAKKLNPSSIIGIDIADEMLEIGRKKVKKANLQEIIVLETGDSENLRFNDHFADAVTVAFGVRNFENREKGLNEIYRIIKPGGKMVILEFSQPTIFPFRQLYNMYFRYILPGIGKFTSKDPKAYKYLYESVQAFPSGKEFIKELEKVGFQQCSWEPLTLGICSIYTGVRS